MAENVTQTSWRVARVGGFDQVLIASGAELVALADLDPKLWVALSCPTSGLKFDARTLTLLDLDGDGHIRAPDIAAACRWVGEVLRRHDTLSAGADTLSLELLDTARPDVAEIANAAEAVLRERKLPSGSISVAVASEARTVFSASRFNGDGVVTPDSAGDDAATRALVEDMLTCVGGVDDASGKPGVDRARVDRFFEALSAHAAWLALGEKDPAVRPLGVGTADARAALERVAAKVDDWFARGRIAAFDARAAATLDGDEKRYASLATGLLTVDAPELATLPLAHVRPGEPLPLSGAVNPAWAAALASFDALVVRPLLGERTSLSEADWSAVRARFAAFDAWQAGRAGAEVSALPRERIDALLAGDGRRKLAALFALEDEAAPRARAIASLERIVRLHRDLFRFCNNFVSFGDFYGRRGATFQAGTLYLDQRSCELCVFVEDTARHALLAPLSRACLVYCDIVRDGQKRGIVAAVTAGNSDNLMVGRNGIFFDRDGAVWGATITKLVDNPISVRQAFWMPYKKAIRFVEAQIAQRAAAADSAATDKLQTGAVAAATTAPPPPAATKGPVPASKALAGPAKLDIGVVAALGVAVGGITAAIGALLESFFGLGYWMPIGFVALLLAISGPSMAIAWLKLRGRNLAPILDANGWAVNAPALVNIAFGRALTRTATLPPGAQRELVDPYSDAPSPLRRFAVALLLVVAAVAWLAGPTLLELLASATAGH